MLTLDNLLGKTKPHGSLTGSANGDGISTAVDRCRWDYTRKGFTQLTVIGTFSTARLQESYEFKYPWDKD